MIINKICILGGTGFVGRSLANRLNKNGYKVRILTRNRERNRDDLILLPNVELVQSNIHDPEQLIRQFKDCDAVINLVGILNERGRDGKGFHFAHVELAEKIRTACAENGIRRVLQMSALNANAESGPSFYLKSKGEAEDRLHGTPDLLVTSYRPSVIFGRHDSFFNRFARLLRITPYFFPLACAHARFAPVYVGDVAEAMARTLKAPDSYGQHYELCGPKQYTLQQLVEYTAHCQGIHRKVVPLNDFLSRLQARVFDFIPGKPFSMDNYLSTRVDSVCQQDGLSLLGIRPTTVESVVPQYLSNRSYRSEYDRFRQHSHRYEN